MTDDERHKIDAALRAVDLFMEPGKAVELNMTNMATLFHLVRDVSDCARTMRRYIDAAPQIIVQGCICPADLRHGCSGPSCPRRVLEEGEIIGAR